MYCPEVKPTVTWHWLWKQIKPLSISPTSQPTPPTPCGVMRARLNCLHIAFVSQKTAFHQGVFPLPLFQCPSKLTRFSASFLKAVSKVSQALVKEPCSPVLGLLVVLPPDMQEISSYFSYPLWEEYPHSPASLSSAFQPWIPFGRESFASSSEYS